MRILFKTILTLLLFVFILLKANATDDCAACLDRFDSFPVKFGSYLKLPYSYNFIDTRLDPNNVCFQSEIAYGPQTYIPTHDVKLKHVFRDENGNSLWNTCQHCPIADFNFLTNSKGKCPLELEDMGCVAIDNKCICSSIDITFGEVEFLRACVEMDHDEIKYPQDITGELEIKEIDDESNNKSKKESTVKKRRVRQH